MQLTPARLVLCVATALSLQSCDSLLEKSENVSIELDSFNLVGSDNAGIIKRAVVTGNPACTASQTSLNSLLTQVDNYDDINEYLDTLDINAIHYRITRNSTSVDATGSMHMTDPSTGQLTTIATVSIPANTTVDDWTPFPFVDGGIAVAQHYMDNLNDSFLYCAEGSPDSSALSMTLELRLDLTVTVDVL